MTKFRDRVDERFAAFARTIFQHRLKTLGLMFALVGALLSQLPTLTADNSIDVWFHQSDPDILAYNQFRDQFGRDEMVVVAVTPPNIFDAGFLRKLTALHDALEEETPYLKEVTSLVNVRDTRGDGDELVVEDLLKVIPATPEAMRAFRQRVMTSHLYPNLYISENEKVAVILLETLAYSPEAEDADLLEGFEDEAPGSAGGERDERRALTEAENSEIVRAVEVVAARFDGPDFPIQLSGPPVVNDYFNASIGRDVGTFMTLAFVSFTVFLLILFRRISGALLTLLIVVVSMLSTISLMAIFGSPFTSVTSILPSFMMSVGVGSSVHVMVIFYRRFKQSGNKEEAIAYTYGHSGVPIVMTGLTTAAGLLSFSTSGMLPVAHLGLFGGAGVLVILVFTLILMPALIAVLPLRSTARSEGKRHGQGMDAILTGIANFSTRHAWAIVIGSALIVIVSGLGLFFQGFGQNFISWLPEDSAVRRGVDLMDREMKGGASIEVVIDVAREDGLYDPLVMQKIEALSVFLEQYEDDAGLRVVGKTSSITDVLQEINQALNENRAAFYRIPEERQLIAQELLLFENSGNDDLERIVDSQFSKARLTARVVNKDAAEYVDFVTAIEDTATGLFKDTATITVTGTLKLFTQMIDLLMISLAKSYTIAAVIITILMMLMLGSVRIGLLSMIPNLAPIIVTMGFMGWVGIKLDMSNMLLGTVAIGLAVDDTIHFFHNFRRYYGQSGNAAEATRQTMLSTGRAILFTTLVLVTGFWMFMFASLNNLIQFGLLIGVTLIIALLADILLAPAMMELITRTAYGKSIAARWGSATA